MPAFKVAYLIHGDDHGRIAERRSKLRAVAEAESGSSGVEVFEADACTPDAVAAALSAMTFAMGRRFVIADGVERWKDKDVAPVAAAMVEMDPETLTVAFFAREEGRAKAPDALHAAVRSAGGVIAAETAVAGKQLPRWVCDRAAELGLRMEPAAARVLVQRTGDRQQRLLRELEKLALELGEGATVTAETIEEACASSSERRTWTLADALVAGDRDQAMRALLELREQGERVTGLVFPIVRRLRDAHDIAVALDAGESPSRIKGRLRMPGFAADRLIADVRRRDAETYRRALELMADLELETRGGGGAALGEDTMAVRAVAAIAG